MHWQHNKRPHESVRQVRQYTPVPSLFAANAPPYSSIRLMNLWMLELYDPWASMSIEKVEQYGDYSRGMKWKVKKKIDMMQWTLLDRYEQLKIVSILTLPSHRPLTPSVKWLFYLCEISRSLCLNNGCVKCDRG